MKEIKFPVYENANVCPVKLFKQYIFVICLFITTSKPYRPASNDKLVLHDAGIYIATVTPYSSRSVSMSKAATKVPIETALKTGCWRIMRAFTNYYNSQIDNSEMFPNSIVM